jgi:xanthine dehydrogenase accessory factor
LVEARTTRKGIAYVVDIKSGMRILTSDGFAERFVKDSSGFEEDGMTFVAIHNPPLRLAIVGAVHIAQALIPMARIAGFDPVVIDPRGAFGSAARFPGETILEDWPDEALKTYGVDARTALVLLTHDPKLDDPALHVGLRSKSFYIGALGSKRTHAKRAERLLAHGFAHKDIDRIHGPIGLDIGAASPQEIAVSILSEMVQVLRQPV